MSKKRTVKAAMGILKTTLGAAEKAADLSGVPIVKPIIELAGSILDIVESVRTNKEDCESIGENATILVKAIVNSLSGKDEKFIDQDLKRQIQELGSKLVEVKHKLEQITMRPAWRRVATFKADAEDIRNCKNELASALQAFQVENNISQRVIEATHHHQMSALIMDMGRVQVTEEFTIFSEVPPAPSVFYGRDDYVTNAITLILTKPSARLAILGSGGIGKTSVALAILHQPQVEKEFGSSRYFVPCDSIITSAALVSMLLQVLKVQREKEDPLACLLQFLRSSKKLILVLDNFETPWDIEELRSEMQALLSHLAAVKSMTLLITMRGTVLPNGLLWTQPALSHLTAFDADAARATYLAHCPNEDSMLDILLKELDYVPLAVTLMASIAQSDASTPTQLLVSWRKEYTAMLRTSHKDRLTNVEISISLSIMSSRMQQEPEAQQLLALVCTLPDGIFHDRWRHISEFFAHGTTAAQTLRQTALAYEDKSRKLQVLSPIRHYVQKHLQLSPSITASLHDLYLKLATLGVIFTFNDMGLPDRNITNILTEEIGNITCILDQVLDLQLNEDTMKAVLGFSMFLYWKHPATSLLEKACEKMAGHNLGLTKAQCLHILGSCQSLLSEFSKAQENLKRASEQFHLIGEPLGVAECLHMLGQISMFLNQYDAALAQLTEAKEQFEVIDEKEGVAQCLQSLGNVARLCNQRELAVSQLTAARKQFEILGNKLGASSCLQSLGDLARMYQEPELALAQLTEAKEQFEAIDFKLGTAQCLASLGDIALMCNQYDLALAQITEAKAGFIAAKEKSGVARCLRSLGEVAIACNQHELAFDQLMEAKEQFDIMEDQLGRGDCLFHLGELARKVGKFDEAANNFQAAKVDYECIGNLIWAGYCEGQLDELGIRHEEL